MGEKIIKAVQNFIGDYYQAIFFLAVIFSIGLGLYNNYQIKNLKSLAPVVAEVKSPKNILKEIPANSVFLGNPNAKVTMVEFADYQCPFCERFFTTYQRSIQRTDEVLHNFGNKLH